MKNSSLTTTTGAFNLHYSSGGLRKNINLDNDVSIGIEKDSRTSNSESPQGLFLDRLLALSG